MQPALSVVIIGRNEGQRLARCLDSVRSVQGINGEIEMIYADSASTDGSRELAAAAGAKVVAVESDHPTAALGRNAGWKLAKSPFILFLDGDTILHPDFVRRAMDALLAEEQVAAVWGHRREVHPERSVYNRILDLDWVFAPGYTDYCGGDVLMRREALEAVGGYDATLIAGEEPELCRRMRAREYRILHIDAPMTGHDLAMTRFAQYWKRAVRAGHAYAEVSSRFRNSPDPLWQPQRRRNFLRGGFWFLSFVIAIAASMLLRSFIPAAVWAGLLLVLSMRSAWHARWKNAHPLTLFLYGLHSHLQQIPIGIGQLQFDLNSRQGRKRRLIEYKENA